MTSITVIYLKIPVGRALRSGTHGVGAYVGKIVQLQADELPHLYTVT